MDHILFFSIAVLICVMPGVTFGQQPSGQKEGGAADPAVKFGEREAKTAAEQDARRDVNKLFWAGAGVAIWVLSFLICVCIGIVVVRVFGRPDTDSLAWIFHLASGFIVVGIGIVVGFLAPFIAIYFYAPSPPNAPLVGKPPEYVEAYTKAYRSKARWTRLTFAAAGVGGVILCGVAVLGVVLR